MKCQKNKQCVKSPPGTFLDPHKKRCTGCDKTGKDKKDKKPKKSEKIETKSKPIPIENINKYWEEIENKHNLLLKNIKDNMPELEKIWDSLKHTEDDIYRFYHHSFKVYFIQTVTERIVNVLRKLSPSKDEPFCKYFDEIICEGTCRNKQWEPDHNIIWTTVTRPFIEAFFHARYFLEMAIKYGKELDKAPDLLPSGWAALLELYNLR